MLDFEKFIEFSFYLHTMSNSYRKYVWECEYVNQQKETLSIKVIQN